MRRSGTKLGIKILVVLSLGLITRPGYSQETPSDYQEVLKIVGKTGDYKSNVLKVNIPRNDLHMNVAGYSLPTPLALAAGLP